MRVEWLRTALANLNAEAEFIAQNNPAAAVRVVNVILQSVNQLKKFPALGRPGRVPGTRELVIHRTPYLIPYRVRKGTIEILRIFHGARRWPEKL